MAEFEKLATTDRRLLTYHARVAVSRRFSGDVEDIVQKALLATWERRDAIRDGSTRNYVVWTVRYMAKWWRTKYGENALKPLPRVVIDNRPNALEQLCQTLSAIEVIDIERIVGRLKPQHRSTYRELQGKNFEARDPSNHGYECRVTRLKKAIRLAA